MALQAVQVLEVVQIGNGPVEVVVSHLAALLVALVPEYYLLGQPLPSHQVQIVLTDVMSLEVSNLQIHLETV